MFELIGRTSRMAGALTTVRETMIPRFIITLQRQRVALGLRLITKRAPIAVKKYSKNYQEGGLRKSMTVDDTDPNRVEIGPTCGYGKYVARGVAGKYKAKAGPRPFHKDAEQDLGDQDPALIEAVAKKVFKGKFYDRG